MTMQAPLTSTPPRCAAAEPARPFRRSAGTMRRLARDKAAALAATFLTLVRWPDLRADRAPYVLLHRSVEGDAGASGAHWFGTRHRRAPTC